MTTAKTAPDLRPHDRATQRLSARLGPGAVVFMVVAAAAPLTVVAGVVPVGIAFGNGSAYPATYVLCTAVLMLFSVGFTTMARHIPEAGAFYTYVRAGLGRPAGVGTAFLALVSYASVQLGVYGFIGASLSTLSTDHGGPSLPWWVWAVAALGITGYLGYRNIELSGRVLGVLLIAEVLVVLVLSIVITVQGGGGAGSLSTDSFSPTKLFSGAPGIAVIFAVAGYIGFESTAIFRDEARDPEKTIPFATYAALLLIGAFYAFAAWALVSAYGDAGAAKRAAQNPGTMLSETATRFLGALGGDLVQILLCTSLFAALLSFHNVLARYIFSLGSAGVLPRSCASSHAKHSSPHVASVIQSISACLLVVLCAVASLDPVTEIFTWFAGVSAVGVIALMLLTSVAVIAYFLRRPDLASPWHGLIAPALGGLGLAVFLALTVDNLPLLVGGSHPIAITVGLALVLSFLGGAALTLVRRLAADDVTKEV